MGDFGGEEGGAVNSRFRGKGACTNTPPPANLIYRARPALYIAWFCAPVHPNYGAYLPISRPQT
jgi:hypothetical protein